MRSFPTLGFQELGRGWLGDGVTLLGAGARIAVRYLLRDDFNDTRAAGSVNGTYATDGVNLRIVKDTANHLALTGGNAVIDGFVDITDPCLQYGTFARLFGRTVVIANNTTSFVNNSAFGFTANTPPTDPSPGNTLVFTSTSFLRVYIGASIIQVGTSLTAGVTYYGAVTLRASGAYYFIKGGAQYPNWTLLKVDTTQNVGNVYVSTNGPGLRSHSFIRIPSELHLVFVAGYDTFTRSNGAMGNSETSGPDGQSATARAWGNSVGTYAIASNVAQASALDTGVAIATMDTGYTDTIVSAVNVRSAGSVGIVTRWVDASNYVRLSLDGTNCVLEKIVAGIPSTVRTTAVTYGATKILELHCNGTQFVAYYGNALVGGFDTIADAALQTGTASGLYTTNTGNTHDNFTVYAKKEGYTWLDRFLA